ncbi:MAG: HAMP domain-containing histidine kinase [Clostridiales bacterium]|nr:HAMP domain-containing histidine kinase [Clostridiales bacterium]
MDRITILFRNSEVKKNTLKFFIVLVLGWIAIIGTCNYLIKDLNKTLLNQNIVIASNLLNNKEFGTIIKSFYENNNKDEISKAREELESYGYDENMTISNNEIVINFYYKVTGIMLSIFTIVILIIYVIYVLAMNNMFLKLKSISKNISYMSKGEYKKIEEEYSEGEMATLISSLNYMGERVNNSINSLKEEKRNMKDFLSDISHQLKTPLASLVMFNDLLREDKKMSSEDKEKFLNSSEEQLRRMGWLIMNLLKVGRLEAGVIKFNMEYQEISDTIDIAISSLKEKAAIKNQQLIVEGDLNCSFIHDREWLAEAISNIVKNSIENTENGGKISILVSKGPLITQIKIVDNGKGIPEDMQDKIFKRFYKGTSSTNPESIGIGLSLAKSIIEEQKGEIKLFSEEGKGTTFIISFYEPL